MNDYPDNWPDIARRVKDLANWRCVRCGHVHEPKTGYCLTVHHLDGDKANCAWWNLAALDQRCHLHIQNTVKITQSIMFRPSPWIMPHVAAMYELGIVEPDPTYSLAEWPFIYVMSTDRLWPWWAPPAPVDSNQHPAEPSRCTE